MKKQHFRPRPLRLAYKRRISLAFKFSFLVFAVGYLVLATAVLSRFDFYRISRLEISGNFAVSESVIAAVVDGIFNDGGFHIWDKSNILLYPTTFLGEKIMEEIKPIASAEVKRLNMNTVSIAVTERTPEGLWCEGSYDAESPDLSGQDCYFFDDKGFIFDKAPSFSNGAYVRFYGGLINDLDPVSQSILPSEVFKESEFFLNTLKSEGIDVVGFELNDEGDYILTTKDDAVILLSPRVGMRRSLQNLTVFLSGAGDTGEAVSIDKFKYVDLRFGNKVYYRLNGD